MERSENLLEAEKLLGEARDHLMHFIGSSYCESDSDDEDMVDKIDDYFGHPRINWKLF